MIARARPLLAAAARRFDRHGTVRYLLRLFAASMFFTIAATAMLAMVGIFWLAGFHLSPLLILTAVLVPATGLGFLCLPSERKPDAAGSWDTVAGEPVGPDSPYRPNWDLAAAQLERLVYGPGPLPPDFHRIRPAIPPADPDGGDPHG